MDLTHLWFFVLATVGFIVAQNLFAAWFNGYKNPIDYYYHEINKNPKAGAWYYGSRSGAEKRGGSHRWNLKRKYPTSISGLPEDD